MAGARWQLTGMARAGLQTESLFCLRRWAADYRRYRSAEVRHLALPFFQPGTRLEEITGSKVN